ncbi:MAG: hypothetical protein ABUL68_05240 [Pseudomonadota bacterium]
MPRALRLHFAHAIFGPASTPSARHPSARHKIVGLSEEAAAFLRGCF